MAPKTAAVELHHVIDGLQLGKGVVGEPEPLCCQVSYQRSCSIAPRILPSGRQLFEPRQRFSADKDQRHG